MGLGRVAVVFFAASLLVQRDAHAAPTRTLVVAADRDDDDLDGRPDGEQTPLPKGARTSLIVLDSDFVGVKFRVTSGGDTVRVVAPDGSTVAWNAPIPRGAALQGLSPGMARVVVARSGQEEPLSIVVVGIGFRDGMMHDLDLTRERASIERKAPERTPPSPDARYDDFDALRATLVFPADFDSPVDAHDVSVESISADGASIDRLDGVAIERIACAPEKNCYVTEPLRFVVDDVDRTHPLVERRSLRAEVGGGIVVRYRERAAQTIRVEGPRASPVGPIGRMKATLRPFVVRVSSGGGPAIGGNDAGAIATVRSELALASASWGQCGVTFGKAEAIDVHVVDAPPNYLVSFGDDLGLPASGGTVRVRIDGKPLSVPILPGASPLGAAREFSAAALRAGFSAVVSPNVRIAPGAASSVDVIVRSGGALARVEPLVSGAPPADDTTMVVRIGSVDLSDGLFHFGDMDSMSGTLEERTLAKAFDDGDPSTIEIIFVPSFTGGDRIGESFIQNDMSSVRNLVVIDRAGVRARRMSSTVAHEIGHVLMNAPGHPDDYGLDTPTQLMDSDAADASPFGPRRLSLDECARAVRESGPKSRVPILTAWPITRLKAGR